MKRLIKIAASVIVILVVAVGGLFAVTFMGRRAMADGREFGGARLVVDGFGAVGVVPTGERQLLLVDAGQDAEGKAILAELTRRGLSGDAVVAILITHGHQDHTGALGRFPKAQVLALDTEVPVVEGREGTHGPLTRLMGAGPTGPSVARPLHDGETFTIGTATVRVFATPGHTAGSAAYLVNDVLFVGDSADVTSDGAIQGAPWIFSDSQAQNRASLVRLARRLEADKSAVAVIVPAHSGPVDGLAPLVAFAQAQ